MRLLRPPFNPTAKFEEAFVERREMQYLYNEGDLYYFMDNETYGADPDQQGYLWATTSAS